MYIFNIHEFNSMHHLYYLEMLITCTHFSFIINFYNNF